MSEVLKVLVNVSADTRVSFLVRRVSATLHVYLFWCTVFQQMYQDVYMRIFLVAGVSITWCMVFQ